jgi:hypothetical protein
MFAITDAALHAPEWLLVGGPALPHLEGIVMFEPFIAAARIPNDLEFFGRRR